MKKKAAGIFFTDGKKVLLLRKKSGDDKGLWGLPGGGVEPKDPNIWGTATRETKEETGLKTIPGKTLDFSREEDTKVIWTSFIVKIDKTFPVHVSKEHDSFKWASLDKLTEMKLHPKLKQNLSKYLQIIKRKFPNMIIKHLNFREFLELGL